MVDVFSKAKRSEVMSRIRARGNRETELVLRQMLRSQRITGWRRHLPLLGRPDFAFPRQRVALFVDGCFWHACPTCGNLPVNNRKFWREKLAGNVARDLEVNRGLRRKGWTVVRVWEHSLKNASRRRRTTERIVAALGRRSLRR